MTTRRTCCFISMRSLLERGTERAGALAAGVWLAFVLLATFPLVHRFGRWVHALGHPVRLVAEDRAEPRQGGFTHFGLPGPIARRGRVGSGSANGDTRRAVRHCWFVERK